MNHIFISYSRTDQAYARQLADDLSRRGFAVWIDDQIDFGERWFKTIVQTIEECAAMVVIMSPEAEESEWVEREILVAQRDHKPIFPLLLRGREFPLLITTQFADVQGGNLPPESFYTRLGRVIAPGSGEDQADLPPMSTNNLPSVEFNSTAGKGQSYPPGTCFTFYWTTNGVSEVYFDGEWVEHQGQVERCPTETRSYILHVVFPDGSSQDCLSLVHID